ncbi:MAG TPA: DinB family protein [Longimicrobiaceae bacterium]|nr:DinB family protein [Longimicrobiaceae bacterium]
MTEIERILDQMRRAYEGEAWHGPSLREALDGVTAAEAAARPVPGAHSIREIVQHLAAWEDTLRRRLAGEPLREPAEGDWPGAEAASEDEWRDLLHRLDERSRRLRDAVAALDDDGLDRAPYPGTSTRYVTLHGAIQHALYHAGQIVLLRKAARAGSAA